MALDLAWPQDLAKQLSKEGVQKDEQNFLFLNKMLPLKNRLPKNEIDLLKSKGKRKFSKNFTLLYSINNKENSRFAIIISKKVSKKAVDRNRIKRIVREAVKLKIQDCHVANTLLAMTCTDYLIIAKQSSLKLTNNEIRKEVEKLLS